jgi:hypothetical protein
MNSNRATTPAMMVSIKSPLQFLAEADVEFARDEERHDARDVDQIIHAAKMRRGEAGG